MLACTAMPLRRYVLSAAIVGVGIGQHTWRRMASIVNRLCGCIEIFDHVSFARALESPANRDGSSRYLRAAVFMIAQKSNGERS